MDVCLINHREGNETGAPRVCSKGTRASCAGRTSAVGTSCAGTGVPMPALDAAVTWMLRIPPTWVDERLGRRVMG